MSSSTTSCSAATGGNEIRQRGGGPPKKSLQSGWTGAQHLKSGCPIFATALSDASLQPLGYAVLFPTFPFREFQKKYFQKVAYFSPLKNTAHNTTFSPQITTQKPQINHHKTPIFLKNPRKNAKTPAQKNPEKHY
jgi:hypothetical protein